MHKESNLSLVGVCLDEHTWKNTNKREFIHLCFHHDLLFISLELGFCQCETMRQYIYILVEYFLGILKGLLRVQSKKLFFI